MAIPVSSAFGEQPPLLRRVARAASLVLVGLTTLVFLGTDAPAAETLRTRPFEALCFLAMWFGLAIAWRHPRQAGVTTLVAWGLLAFVSHGATSGPTAAFLVVGLLNLAASRTPQPYDQAA